MSAFLVFGIEGSLMHGEKERVLRTLRSATYRSDRRPAKPEPVFRKGRIARFFPDDFHEVFVQVRSHARPGGHFYESRILRDFEKDRSKEPVGRMVFVYPIEGFLQLLEEKAPSGLWQCPFALERMNETVLEPSQQRVPSLGSKYPRRIVSVLDRFGIHYDHEEGLDFRDDHFGHIHFFVRFLG